MKEKLEEANRSLKIMKNKEMEGTRYLSMLQNKQLLVELKNQSNQIEFRIEENKVLKRKIEELEREVSTQKFVEINFSKKSTRNQKRILGLTENQNFLVEKFHKYLKMEKKIEKKIFEMEGIGAKEDLDGDLEKRIFDLERNLRNFGKIEKEIFRKNGNLKKNLGLVQKKSFFNIDYMKEFYDEVFNFESEIFTKKFWKSKKNLKEKIKIEENKEIECIEHLVIEIYPLLKSLILNTFLIEEKNLVRKLESNNIQLPKIKSNLDCGKNKSFMKKKKDIENKIKILMMD